LELVAAPLYEKREEGFDWSQQKRESITAILERLGRKISTQKKNTNSESRVPGCPGFTIGKKGGAKKNERTTVVIPQQKNRGGNH